MNFVPDAATPLAEDGLEFPADFSWIGPERQLHTEVLYILLPVRLGGTIFD